MVPEDVFKHRMTLIESLVSELNELCKRYVAQPDEFKDLDRIPIIFNAIKDQGIKIVAPQITYSSPEFELLSTHGQRNFEKLMTFREMRKELKELDWEREHDLQDIEKDLVSWIRDDFSTSTANQYFIFPSKNIEFVILNDSENDLKSLFKYSAWEKVQ